MQIFAMRQLLSKQLLLKEQLGIIMNINEMTNHNLPILQDLLIYYLMLEMQSAV